MTLGEVFRDAEVARAYRHRATYPAETFAILERLLVAPRTVLDAGAGTGSVARPMASFASRVDAVDPSVAMINEGRALPGGDDPKLRWIVGSAEDAPLDPPYGLITAGSSIHWMDPAVVMPRFAAALAPDARLAILETDDGTRRDEDHPFPELLAIIKKYSEIRHHIDNAELMTRLEAEGWFVREGAQRTAELMVRRTAEEFLEYLHSTSSLARVRLGDRAQAFDDEVRAVFAAKGLTVIEQPITATVIWGRPVAK
jgi:SAM-dependent methyltransferase